MSDARRRYEDLLRDLHAYRKAQLESCPAAISITHEMSKLWNKLTVEEQEEVSEISEALRAGGQSEARALA